MTNAIAERARKTGGTTIWSIGGISQYQCLHDNNEEFVAPQSMLEELTADSRRLMEFSTGGPSLAIRNEWVPQVSLLRPGSLR